MSNEVLLETGIEYARQAIGWLSKKLPELDSYLYGLSEEELTPTWNESDKERIDKFPIFGVLKNHAVAPRSNGFTEPCPPEKCPICEPTKVPRGTCRRPTPGWFCTLDAGHNGPCPAWPMHHLDTNARG